MAPLRLKSQLSQRDTEFRERPPCTMTRVPLNAAKYKIIPCRCRLINNSEHFKKTLLRPELDRANFIKKTFRLWRKLSTENFSTKKLIASKRTINYLHVCEIKGLQFRWLNLRGIEAAFTIWIMLFPYHLKWNCSKL